MALVCQSRLALSEERLRGTGHEIRDDQEFLGDLPLEDCLAKMTAAWVRRVI